MKTIISFGKIAFNGTRRVNEVIISIALNDYEDGKVGLSICGDIWNSRHTEILCGGQCLDTIAKYVTHPLFKEIKGYWEQYHLNDKSPYTQRQKDCIDSEIGNDRHHTYESIVEILKNHNLYDDNGCVYAKAWYYREIPQNVVDRIREIIINNKSEC